MGEFMDRVERLTVDLIKIPSINGTIGELEIAQFIYDYFARNPYFQKHPEYLNLVPLDGDRLGRANVFALVKGEKGPSNKAVILHGHIDTVGVSDFGILEPYAFDPYELEKKLLEMDLPEEVRQDLLSGEWLFGRGACDMKAGVAAHMCVMDDLIKNVHSWSGNVLYMANPIEENQHTGVMDALRFLRKLKEEDGLDFVAAINNDYTSPLYPGDPKRYMYLGAVGKLLPCFYITGKETHVGQSFEGFDPSLLAAELVRRIDLNVALCDEAEGEVTGPPTVLKMQDLKTHYTVQTPGAAFVYANYFTHDIPVDRVVEQLKEVSRQAADAVTAYLDEQYRAYCERTSTIYRPLGWKVRVMSYSELYEEVERVVGPGLKERLRELADELLRGGTDYRVVCMRVVEEVKKLHPDKTPTVVVFFAPPYCPHNFLRGKTPRERAVFGAVTRVASEYTEETGEEMEVKRFFPCLSDSSYLMMDDSDESVNALIGNFPQWEQVYPVPIQEIRRANIPALNFGTYGKDCHKWTERVYKPFTFEALPKITLRALELLLSIE